MQNPLPTTSTQDDPPVKHPAVTHGRIRTQFQEVILYTLLTLPDEECYGKRLAAILVEEYDPALPTTSIYASIESLADQELVEVEPHNERRKCITLTDRGREYIARDAQWRAQKLHAAEEVVVE